MIKELEKKSGECGITEVKEKEFSFTESFKKRAIYNVECKIRSKKHSMCKREEDYEAGNMV